MIFMLFMWMVFGLLQFNYPMAVVVPGYASDASLDAALDDDELPETQLFLDYLNNDSLIGETIVQSHVEEVGHSEAQFEAAFAHHDLSVIVVLPENFETTIRAARNGTWTGGAITVTLRTLNINEDYLKNLYFGFQRKLKVYMDTEFPNEIEVTYTYTPADLERTTFPRIWTLGSADIVYAILTVSMLLSASLVFVEKTQRMFPELSLVSVGNQFSSYAGKMLASSTFTFAVNFPIVTMVVLNWVRMPVPAHFGAFVGIAFLIILFGASLGLILGCLIPEQVFTFPAAVFLVLVFIFVCGGFVDLELFPQILQEIVQWIPFTYCFVPMKASLLPGLVISGWYIFGLVIWIVVSFVGGARLYTRRIIRG